MKKLILSLVTIVTLSLGATVEDAQIAFDKKDFDTAIKIAEPLANQGDVQAQLILAYIYSEQNTYADAMKDNKKAIYWAEKVVDRFKNTEHYKTILYKIGVIYDYSGDKNYTKALEYFEKACKNNHEAGCSSYQRLKEENIKFEKYQKLANQGDVEAQYEIGFMYNQGDGVQNDNKKANHWYEKAANQGHIDAQFYLGENYFSGYGIPKDFKKAIYWYEKAANLGRIDAQNKLGNIYNHIIAASRTSIPKDLKKAIYWHEKAAVQYDNNFYKIYGLNSMAELMEIYSSHDSEEKDLEKAFSLYEVHCNSYSRNDNINKSCEKMKKIAYKINNPEFEQAEKLAKKGKATDQYNLGQLYYKDKNIKEALYWFEQAANQGYAKAQYNLGVIYDKQKDTQKAFYWTEKAANQGLSVAQFNLGLTYLDTKNKSENPEKAFYWMEKAANQGDLDAMNYLGLMYKKGYGVNQNYTKASEWYKKACQKGNSNGCENYKKLLN